MTATSPRYVIGVDPGTSTGIVLWDNLHYETVTEHTCDPKAAIAIMTMIINDCITDGNPPVIVAERFDISQDTLRKSRDGINDLIRVLGAAWGLTVRYALPFYEQGRSDTKNFASDEALKKRDLWIGTRHERDALRVIFTFLARYDPSFVKNYWAVS